MPLITTVSPGLNARSLALVIYAVTPVFSPARHRYFDWGELRNEDRQDRIDRAQRVLDMLVSQKLLGVE